MTAPWVRTAEFDAFGPWVMPVTTPHEVPPLFRQAADLTGARLVVKVPRPIERRDARPDMDLYDHLVTVRPDAVEVLTRGAHGDVRHTRAAGTDLLALENSVALLAGRLTLHTRTAGPVEIAYNGASAVLVERLVREIRRLWRPDPGDGAPDARAQPGPPGRGVLGPDDQDLVSRVRDLHAADPALRPLRWRRRSAAHRRGSSLTCLLDRLFPAELHAAVVGTTGSEIVVVHRRRQLARRTMPVHSLATTVVPLGRGLHLEPGEDAHWRGVVRLRLAPTPITFLARADDGLEAVLRDLLR